MTTPSCSEHVWYSTARRTQCVLCIEVHVLLYLLLLFYHGIIHGWACV